MLFFQFLGSCRNCRSQIFFFPSPSPYLQPSSGAHQVSLLSVTSFAHPYRSAPVCKKENSANLASEHIYIRPPNIHKSMEWQLWQKIKHTHKQLVCKKEFQSRQAVVRVLTVLSVVSAAYDLVRKKKRKAATPMLAGIFGRNSHSAPSPIPAKTYVCSDPALIASWTIFHLHGHWAWWTTIKCVSLICL